MARLHAGPIGLAEPARLGSMGLCGSHVSVNMRLPIVAPTFANSGTWRGN